MEERKYGFIKNRCVCCSRGSAVGNSGRGLVGSKGFIRFIRELEYYFYGDGCLLRDNEFIIAICLEFFFRIIL